MIVSLGFHALLAVAIVWGGSFVSVPEVRAELDLSSVELSFAEEVAETPPVPLAPPPSPEPKALPPKPAEPPPDVVPEKRLPPEPEAMRMREPDLPIERMKTPVAKREGEEAKPEPPKPETKAAPTAPAPRQARVDAPPRPKRAIRPEYPKGARQRGEEGQVVLEIEVGSSGDCTGVRIVTSSGFPELDEAAVRAARNARFTPAKAEGRAVASTARLTLDFKLK